MQLEHQITVFLCLLYALLLEPLGWWEQDWGGEAVLAARETLFTITPQHIWNMGEKVKAPADSLPPRAAHSPAPSPHPPPRPRDTEGWGSHWKVEVHWDLTLKERNRRRRVGRVASWQMRGWAKVGSSCSYCWKNAEKFWKAWRDKRMPCGFVRGPGWASIGRTGSISWCKNIQAYPTSPLLAPPAPTTAVISLLFFLFLQSLFLSLLPSFLPSFLSFFFLSFLLSCTFPESSGKGQVPGSSHSIPGHSYHWAPSSQLPCAGPSIFQTSMPSTFQPSLPNSHFWKDEKSILLILKVLTPTREMASLSH